LTPHAYDGRALMLYPPPVRPQIVTIFLNHAEI